MNQKLPPSTILCAVLVLAQRKLKNRINLKDFQLHQIFAHIVLSSTILEYFFFSDSEPGFSPKLSAMIYKLHSEGVIEQRVNGSNRLSLNLRAEKYFEESIRLTEKERTELNRVAELFVGFKETLIGEKKWEIQK